MVGTVRETADVAARVRALTDHASTLMVEAAAGTGKTALLAGRLVLLMAAGVAPSALAAITFTELAAAELAARVREYATVLLAGGMPPGISAALPLGLTETQRLHLRAAFDCLDELEAVTIHGFCQDMISAHAIEAGVDPGAQVIDADGAKVFLRAVFDEWFRGRMSAFAEAGEPAAVLARDDPARVADTLWKLVQFRLRHRSARTEQVDWTRRPDIELRSAVDGFRRWMSGVEPEGLTLGVLEQLESLANFYDGCFEQVPSFERLWMLGKPTRTACMRKDSFELLPLKTVGAWQKLVGKDLAGDRARKAGTHFAAADTALRAVLGQVATALVETLARELDGLLDAYSARKRSAAILDFDDLLELACVMVRDHEPVRQALGRRYVHIAVDEFQDTDRVQCEILFRLAARVPAPRWQDCSLRPGALFLVGDPKQAIYRFRGAAAETYQDARATILRSQPDAVLHITANFRSRPAILEHVNQCFRGPLARHGYVDMSPTVERAPRDITCVAKLVVRTPPYSTAQELRETEAGSVADLCARLLRGYRIRAETGGMRALVPGDIALLVPASSDLWIYERELERCGLALASQAGKGFYRRQEIQDLLALARVLADPADTLAFGALMRGPLVGLTDETLLDITAALPPAVAGETRFDVRTSAEVVNDSVARHTLQVLQRLRGRLWAATPHQVLSEAVDSLLVRAKLVQREPLRSIGALANVDVFLELARPYDVRGMLDFSRDITAEWREGRSFREGLSDVDDDAIALVTMHGAKGLEWPVVIPVNCASQFRHRDPFVHRASDDTLHWLLGDVVPPGLMVAQEEERVDLTREREQLWYVACTRASDLLVLPEIAGARTNSWARVVDLALASLPEVAPPQSEDTTLRPKPAECNTQTADAFGAQQMVIDAVSTPVEWLRPSDADGDRLFEADPPWEGAIPPAIAPDIVGPGRVRGLVLHRLLEEMISGELRVEAAFLEARASVLLAQVTSLSLETGPGPEPVELAATALAAAKMPELSDIWPRLVPEAAIYAMSTTAGNPARPLSGRVDAIMVENGCAALVVDWKSDVAPGPQQVREHVEQIQLYLGATGAPRGALVYLSSRTVQWVRSA